MLLPGDPNRATRIAELFDGGLEASRLVNEHRGMLGYTGTYKGMPVSVQTTGMGTPSLSIVVEELLRLGATRLIRVGTTGGIGRGVRTGDLVIATAAAPVDGATRTYLHGDPYAPAADFELTRALVDAARARGVEPHRRPGRHRGRLLQPRRGLRHQVARARHPGLRDGGRRRCSTSPRARAAAGDDVRAACILTVTDTLSEEETSEGTYLSLDDLERGHRPDDRGGAGGRRLAVGRCLAGGRQRRGQPASHEQAAIPVGVNLTTIGVSDDLVARVRAPRWRRPASPRPGSGTTS